MDDDDFVVHDSSDLMLMDPWDNCPEDLLFNGRDMQEWFAHKEQKELKKQLKKEKKQMKKIYSFDLTGNIFPVNDREFAVNPAIQDKDTAIDLANTRIDFIEKLCSLQFAYHFGKLGLDGNLTLMKKMGCKTPYDVWMKINAFKKRFVKTKIGYKSINSPVALYKSHDKRSWIIELEEGVFTTLRPKYNKAMDAILGC